MDLTLIGHDRRFAVEQAVFNYFPHRDGGRAVVRLSPGGRLASAVIEYNGKTAKGRARAGAAGDGCPNRSNARSIDNALRLAFYRAAKQLIDPPPWGALTGVRPVKKAIELLDSGQDVTRGLQKRYDVSPIRSQMASDCAAGAALLRGRLSRRDIALYIGIPFCPTRCAYCSFVSLSAGRDNGLIERYIDVLCDEIAFAGEAVQKHGLCVRTVYWGGGTPAVLSPGQFTRLTDALAGSFVLDTLWEHTVEAGRPDAITPEKLSVYRAGGVTRISVNPQTLDQTVLDVIGRRHTAGQFFTAYAEARASGVECINTDLIAGLPEDSADGFLAGLEQILALAPENITIHTLAKKRASRVMGEQMPVCPAGTVGAMLDGAVSRMREGGYAPYYLYRQKFTEGGYENTGWAKPGHECVYNLCMMEELCTVLSLGAGGVTKVVRRSADGSVDINRLFHCKYPLEYIGRRDTIRDIPAAFAAAVSAAPEKQL